MLQFLKKLINKIVNRKYNTEFNKMRLDFIKEKDLWS